MSKVCDGGGSIKLWGCFSGTDRPVEVKENVQGDNLD